jgi:hypothetical protein
MFKIQTGKTKDNNIYTERVIEPCQMKGGSMAQIETICTFIFIIVVLGVHCDIYQSSYNIS